MEVMLVWCIAVSLIIAMINVIYRIYLWQSAMNNYDRPIEESNTARNVILGLGLLLLAFTGPLFLLGVLVYGLIKFVKALNYSMSKSNN